MDGNDFHPFNEYGEIVTMQEKGTWVEMNLQAVKARYFPFEAPFSGLGTPVGRGRILGTF